MRRSQNWQTIHTKRKNASVEDTIASQTSEWTIGTQNRTKTRTATTNRDLDDYDDVIAQELDSLFITPEEQQAIRSILELARKGKINSSNAFDLPVKVISPQASEHSNMRFWKFASQLLQTSMNIYDKRVQNVFLSSNHMAHSLTRAHRSSEQDLSDEQLRLKSKKKKRQLIQMDIEDLCQSETISSYEIKHVHTEDPSKITMKEQKIMVLRDPFFNKVHEAFDSNSLARLFLNCLEIGQHLQLLFITQGPLLHTSKDFYLEESIDIRPQNNESIMDLYGKQLKKLTFICENRVLFSEIGKFRQTNLGRKQFKQNQFQRYIELFDAYGQSPATQNLSNYSRQEGDPQSLMHSNEMNPINLLPDIKGDVSYSLDATLNDESTPYWSNQLPCSQARPNQTLLDRQQCHTVMTPCELEFKGMKLQKRKLNQTTRNRSIKNKALDNSLEILFTPQQKELRHFILHSKIEDQLQQYRLNIVERFLLPKMMNPVAEILKKRTKRQISSIPAHENCTLPQKSSQLQQLQLKMEHPFDKSEKNTTTNNNTYLVSEQRVQQSQSSIELQDHSTLSVDLLPYSNVSSECIRNLKTFGLRSIRQMKYFIYEQIVQHGSISIADLNLKLSPASTLIIFLHLVNEKNLTVTSIQNEADVRMNL